MASPTSLTSLASLSSLTRQPDLHPIVDGFIVGEVTVVELPVAVVLRVPEVVGSIFQIRCPFHDWVFVKAIEAGLVDDIEDGLFGVGNGQGGVTGSGLSVGLHTDHRTKMDALLRIASGVACHRQLCGDGLHMMWYLSCEGDTTIDVATHPDSDQLIRVRGKVLALYPFPVTQIAVFHDTAVEAEATVIVADGSQSEVFDMQRAEGLKVLTVRPLHM